ncbi:MAG: CC0125/CC1285 family lipoprotein [Pseudomonas sp.]
MRIVTCLCFVAFLSACTTPYQRDGFAGGYSEIQLDENIWRVTFEGNGYTTALRVEELALLRSAELTLEKGAAAKTECNT